VACFDVGNSVPPTEIEDGLNAADVTRFKCSDMCQYVVPVSRPYRRVQMHTAGLVDCHFSVSREDSVQKHVWRVVLKLLSPA